MSLFSYSKDEFERIDNFTQKELHHEFKQKLNNLIEDERANTGKSYNEIFEKLTEEFNNVLNNLSSGSYEHFKYFHKYLTLDIINILKQIDIHANSIFGTTRGIISFFEAKSFKEIVEKHGFMALELSFVYTLLNDLIEQLNKEIQKYK